MWHMRYAIRLFERMAIFAGACRSILASHECIKPAMMIYGMPEHELDTSLFSPVAKPCGYDRMYQW